MAGNIASWASILMRARDFLPAFTDIAIEEDRMITPAKPLNAGQLRRRLERQAATQRIQWVILHGHPFRW